MTPCIEAMREHAIAKLANESEGELVRIELDDGPFAALRQQGHHALCWAMSFGDTHFGEVVIATKSGNFIIGLENADPFYEAKPSKEYRIQSETERLILENDALRAYQTCHDDMNEDLTICKHLGVLIAPHFRGAGKYQTLVYDRNDLIPTGE